MSFVFCDQYSSMSLLFLKKGVDWKAIIGYVKNAVVRVTLCE